MSERLNLKILVPLLILGALVWWLRYHPGFPHNLEYPVYDGDARQHVYWTARFQDPSLFPNDPITDFFASQVFAPPGHHLVYKALTPFMDPVAASQAVCLAVVLLSLFLMERLCAALGMPALGRAVAVGLSLFFFEHLWGGLPRNYKVPILLGHCWLLVKDRQVLAAALVPLQAVFYPPMVPITLTLSGLRLATALWPNPLRGIGEPRTLGRISALAAATLVTFLYLTTAYSTAEQETVGRQVTAEEARAMPEFGPDGRTPFFNEGWWTFVSDGRSGFSFNKYKHLLIILGAVAVFSRFRALRFPRLSGELLGTGLGLWALAHAVLFALHIPARYTDHTLPLAFLLAVGMSLGAWAPRLEAMYETWLAGSVRGLPVWGVLLAGAGLFLVVQHATRFPDVVAVDQAEFEMLRALDTLPKYGMVAGHPRTMNNVPIHTSLPVVASKEAALPYYTGYYAVVSRRIRDSFEAYYAGDFARVEAFAARYGVTALVIRHRHFTPRYLKKRIFPEPFNAEVKAAIAGQRRFALADPPQDLVFFRNAEYTVLRFPREAGRE